MAPNPNTRWRSTTRTRPRAGGAQPQYSWRSEKRIFSYQPSQARLTLSFLFEPRWSPATHPAGCTVRLIFDGAEIIEWQHDPGPQAEAGQCSDLRYCKPRVFTLDLLNDQLSFAATRVSIEVDDSRS